jgi:hypothetical protein
MTRCSKSKKTRTAMVGEPKTKIVRHANGNGGPCGVLGPLVRETKTTYAYSRRNGPDGYSASGLRTSSRAPRARIIRVHAFAISPRCVVSGSSQRHFDPPFPRSGGSKNARPLGAYRASLPDAVWVRRRRRNVSNARLYRAGWVLTGKGAPRSGKPQCSLSVGGCSSTTSASNASLWAGQRKPSAGMPRGKPSPSL